jgi:hypothetical protein
MIDWRTAVRTQYGIEPTADATQVACDRWGWTCQFVVDPVRGARLCVITVPLDDGDVERLGVGATPDEAACRALVQLPHDPPAG